MEITPSDAIATESELAANRAKAARGSRPSLCRLFALVFLFAMGTLMALALSVPAEAMEAVRCTGRPNSDDDPTVIMGNTQSRITFEASVEEGEGISEITLTIPEGTTFSTDDLALTLLTGDDLMTRTEVDYALSVDGQDITFTFSPAITQAGHLNIIIYGVYFPQGGGEMQVQARYVSAAGEQELDGIPVISVQGISTTEAISQWLEAQP